MGFTIANQKWVAIMIVTHCNMGSPMEFDTSLPRNLGAYFLLWEYKEAPVSFIACTINDHITLYPLPLLVLAVLSLCVSVR